MNIDKRFGATITTGPMNWQIIQQEDGKADIELGGSWYHPEEHKEKVRVYVRLYREKDNLSVINSVLAETDMENVSWHCTLKGVPAGGPYRIETLMQDGDNVIPFEFSSHGDMRHHIGVGDVFLIAGQSNAVGYGRDSIEDSPEVGIHMLRDNGMWDLATHPLHDTTDTIFPDSQDGANTGHSPYLAFAKTMKRKHLWPIGLIMAAKGGAPLDRFDPQGEGSLYRNMLKMVGYQGGKIRGIIWCQGASDANAQASVTYKERLARTILQTRKDLNYPDLPWFIVQVSRFGNAGPEADHFWGRVRDSQRLLAHELPNVHTISTIDSITSDAVHNNAYSNVMIGERIAGTVLHFLYGIKHFLCPDIKSAEMGENDNRVILTFDNVIENVSHVHDQDMPFGILFPDGRENYIISLISEGNKITIDTKEPVAKGSTAAGAWQTNPSFKVPFDPGTRLPILSFYNVKIKGAE